MPEDSQKNHKNDQKDVLTTSHASGHQHGQDCDHNHGDDSRSNNHPHDHSHGNGHGHHHHHSVKNIGLAFFLNLAFCIVEIIGGLWTNSAAILSDAVHDLGDSLALGFAWWAEKKSVRPSDAKYSYGYRRFSILSALVTGTVLFVGSLGMIGLSIYKMLNPEPVMYQGMLWLAVLGILFNGFGVFRLSKEEGLNAKMMRLHLLEDVLGWIAILVVSVLMYIYPEPRLDSIAALLIACWVLSNATKNLSYSLRVFLQATPNQVSIKEVESFLKSHSQIVSIHHSHFWSMDGEHHIYTTHLVMEKTLTWEQVGELKNKLKQELFDKFHISEATLEIEKTGDSCVDPSHREEHS